MKILVATSNPGKLRELTEMLGTVGTDIQWLSLNEFTNIPEVVEDGTTFARNAQKKALGYAKATGLWTLADDSGLAIDALDGRPGVLSARFAADEYSPPAEGKYPEGGRGHKDRKELDKANYRKVLRLLKNVPPPHRTARFACHLCLADEKQILLETTGTVEGVITESPVGENGFGYDPIFYIPSLGKTAAQLPNHEKNKISHRGSALRKLKPLLENLLKSA
jgi:XTP/dITP diphosphohydrolase